jgi:hypothetical protein
MFYSVSAFMSSFNDNVFADNTDGLMMFSLYQGSKVVHIQQTLCWVFNGDLFPD